MPGDEIVAGDNPGKLTHLSPALVALIIYQAEAVSLSRKRECRVTPATTPSSLKATDPQQC